MEEKTDEQQQDAPVVAKSFKWGKILVAIFIFFLAAAVLAAFVGKTTKPPSENIESTESFASAEAEAKIVQDDAEAFLSRATGQQYLLGVGKADITG